MTEASIEEQVRYEVADRAAWITLNRPERRNALSSAVLRRLVDLFGEADNDDDVSLLVVTGAGGKAFCAGRDLKELDGLGRAADPPMRGPHRNTFEALFEVGKPTLAVINGFALAGGFELAMACDLRIATDSSTFGMPEARIGMGANFATVLLPRLVPRAVALELLYTGRRFGADEALRLGLLNRVCAEADLASTSAELVSEITGNAPLTLRRYKQMTTKGWDLSVHAALRLDVGPNPYRSEDRVEGVRAFLERRKPVWRAK